MNIFVTYECPKEAARCLLNKHVIKMPLESLQMMSTIATWLKLPAPYRPVMLNHPCTIWARKSRQNFLWLWEHAKELCKEYTARYFRTHKCETTMKEYDHVWKIILRKLPDIGLTEFAVAISDHMKCRTVEGFDNMTVVEKYRQYYMHDKKRIAIWSRNKPDWWCA